MINLTCIEFTRAMKRNLYPDSDSKRLHLKGIEAAIEYLNRPKLVNKFVNWIEKEQQND